MDPQLPTRPQQRRLREIYRSAGWPCHDMVEVELLAAGWVSRRADPGGHETLRVTESGLQILAQVLARNRAARSPHEMLVEQVAQAMARAGRLTWRGLALRAPVPTARADLEEAESPSVACDLLETGEGLVRKPAEPGSVWCVACPDVFSIRHSSVEAYLEPVVHEIKVNRSDLLSDLKKPAKRAAYLAMASACWYVLGEDAKGRAIGQVDEIPPECGVMLAQAGRLIVAREAPRRAVAHLPFHVWMALAKAGPAQRDDEGSQGNL
ncbi:hypothetical protein [Hydrogenophaga sp.]|uniref:hypothetical protein n=1 Tax=Hydrogenophaga sp. TaxID=1904254 RepID=UPI003563512C